MARVPDGVKAKSFTSPVARLSMIEKVALDCIHKIASEHREATQQEIREAIGYSVPGTATGVVNRLVAKGYVERIGGPLQKSLWLKIVATNEITAEPRDKTPHWRYRTESVPTPTIHRVAEYAKPLAEMIEAKARSLGKPLAEFLMDCVYVGFNEICHDSEQ
jgi:hypothetical protein